MSVRSVSFFDEADDPIRVLHVDDEPEFSRVAAEFLESASDNLTVHTESSVSAGLDHLERTEIDCVVSDFEMPEMNGLAFLDVARDRRPGIPFILMTGKESDEIASEAIDAGVTDYLQKEIGTTQYTLLANRIENAVEQRRVARHHRATELVVDINRTLLRNETKSDIADGVCRSICSHDVYDFAWIGTTDSSGAWLETHTFEGELSDHGSGLLNEEDASPAPDSTLSAALETGKIRTATVSIDSTTGRHEGNETSSRPIAVVPAVRDETTEGVLCVSKDRSGFDAMERSLLEWLAHDLAEALGSATGFELRPDREEIRP